ncbi:serine/threonine dehydratase [Hahella sp. HN01]|uniref:serine/threonine dehydratase n=1 Tax=Hahella sp. HN01 TaxID=2847262 RepID=UPI001C1EA005|nr:serine/threonine dehydratase [Hahella sp. HN01]
MTTLEHDRTLGIADIAQAKRRIHGYTLETPLVSSSLLNQWLGHEVYFKAECLQKVGAFKARGGCNTVRWLLENGRRPERIIANSSGNHAQAVAWASSLFGIPSTIFMPENVSRVKARATESYGAEVALCATRAEVDERVLEAAKDPGVYWIPPYNHEQVICGQGTAAYEALHELGEVDAVFAPCGGGGLVSGTLIATRALAPKAEMIAAEPLQANDAAISLRENKIHRLSATPDTLADGARTLAVGDITFEYIRQLDALYEVEEQRIAFWTQWLTHLLKLHIEPTSAMTMDAVRQWLKGRSGKKRLLVILTGGNVDQGMMSALWRDNYLNEFEL